MQGTEPIKVSSKETQGPGHHTQNIFCHNSEQETSFPKSHSAKAPPSAL
jgi:hypothetical protein